MAINDSMKFSKPARVEMSLSGKEEWSEVLVFDVLIIFFTYIEPVSSGMVDETHAWRKLLNLLSELINSLTEDPPQQDSNLGGERHFEPDRQRIKMYYVRMQFNRLRIKFRTFKRN